MKYYHKNLFIYLFFLKKKIIKSKGWSSKRRNETCADCNRLQLQIAKLPLPLHIYTKIHKRISIQYPPLNFITFSQI